MDYTLGCFNRPWADLPSETMVDHVADGGMSYLLVIGGYSEELIRTVEYASERNVTVLIKPHKGPCTTGLACLEAVKKINSPSLVSVTIRET